MAGVIYFLLFLFNEFLTFILIFSHVVDFYLIFLLVVILQNLLLNVFKLEEKSLRCLPFCIYKPQNSSCLAYVF